MILQKNHPEHDEGYILPEDQKKVVISGEGNHSATFIIEREDHTLGNLLKMQLLRDPDVLFAGYRAPHPLEYKIEIKISTTDSTTPQVVLNRAIDCLIREFDQLNKELNEETSYKKDK